MDERRRGSVSVVQSPKREALTVSLAGTAPTSSLIRSPFLYAAKVGMARMDCSAAIC